MHHSRPIKIIKVIILILLQYVHYIQGASTATSVVLKGDERSYVTNGGFRLACMCLPRSGATFPPSLSYSSRVHSVDSRHCVLLIPKQWICGHNLWPDISHTFQKKKNCMCCIIYIISVVALDDLEMMTWRCANMILRFDSVSFTRWHLLSAGCC